VRVLPTDDSSSEPTTLPEGMVLTLVLDDEGDNLDDDERAELHAAMDESREQIKRGDFATADELLSSYGPDDSVHNAT
jgi:hypothetical protein